MAYRYVCEPCRQAIGLDAERSHLNRIRRLARRRTLPDVVRRDPTGKPLLVGVQHPDVYEITETDCVCACQTNGHDPDLCTGEANFGVGGRPGSGFVDQLAEELGREPIPELITGRQDECEVLVRSVLAWWFSLSEADKMALEAELDSKTWRYEDQIMVLRDLLASQRPDLIAQAPYRDLKARLKELAKFRDEVAHSRPRRGDYFTRIKRVKGVDTIFHISAEELARYLDMSMHLQSQLSFLPMYLSDAATVDSDRQGRAA